MRREILDGSRCDRIVGAMPGHLDAFLGEEFDEEVAAIAAALPDPPSHTAVRTFLRILEQKGQVRRRKDGKRHFYTAIRSRKRFAIIATVSFWKTTA